MQRFQLHGDLDKPQLKVRVALTDEDKFEHVGTVNFVDNQLDPTTGTLRCRARVENENRFFSPGMFVRLRFPIGGQHSALLVPEESLGTDQGQKFVYVVADQKDDKGETAPRVIYRQVKPGQQFGQLRVIEDGLKANEQVIVSGLQRVRPGAKVTPKGQGAGAKGKAQEKAPEPTPNSPPTKSAAD